MYIDIILFAILAAVLATNLYKILGKKTISEDFSRNEKIEKDNKIFSNEVMDYSEKQIDIIKLIKFLLKDKGMTINGVKNVLKSNINSLDDYNSYSLKTDYNQAEAVSNHI